MALEHPWSEPPATAQTIEVAPGVRWLRMPLPFQLDHILRSPLFRLHNSSIRDMKRRAH
jgi:hypothetical protein